MNGHRTARLASLRTFALSLITVAAVAASAGGQAGTQTQVPRGTVPASISNAEFWRLHETFSEPGGVFSSDNFTSNEMAISALATELRQRGRTGGAYVGVGPEQNFTYIAALKPDIVFLVDVRRQAIMQHLMYKAIFEMSANRSEFIANLFSLPIQAEAVRDTSILQLWARYLPLAPDSALYSRNRSAIFNRLVNVRGIPLSAADSVSLWYVYEAFYQLGPGINYGGYGRGATVPSGTNPRGPNFVNLSVTVDAAGLMRGFLATEADFQFVKDLHSRNMIVTVVGDFGGPKALRSVGEWLREHGTVVTAFYVSNVEQYLFSPIDKFSAFYASVATMPLDSASLFIRPASSGPAGNAANASSLATAWAERETALSRSRGVPSAQSNTSQRPPVTTLPPRSTAATPPVSPIPPTTLQTVAQDPNRGSVTGIARDSATGAVLPNVTVTLDGTNTAATTGADGRFTLVNINPGLFSIVARRLGYESKGIDLVRVAAGVPVVMDIKLLAAPITYSGVVSTGTGTWMVSSSGGRMSGGANSARVELCPIMAYLAAFNAGLVRSSAQASTCGR